MTGTCDDCAYNVYDDEMDEYVCEAYLDEDEFYRLMQTGKKAVRTTAPAMIMNWYATRIKEEP